MPFEPNYTDWFCTECEGTIRQMAGWMAPVRCSICGEPNIEPEMEAMFESVPDGWKIMRASVDEYRIVRMGL